MSKNCIHLKQKMDKKEDILLFKFENNKVEYFELDLELEQELEI